MATFYKIDRDQIFQPRQKWYDSAPVYPIKQYIYWLGILGVSKVMCNNLVLWFLYPVWQFIRRSPYFSVVNIQICSVLSDFQLCSLIIHVILEKTFGTLNQCYIDKLIWNPPWPSMNTIYTLQMTEAFWLPLCIKNCGDKIILTTLLLSIKPKSKSSLKWKYEEHASLSMRKTDLKSHLELACGRTSINRPTFVNNIPFTHWHTNAA